MQNIVGATDRLTTTIRLGTHYAMMLYSRNDINQIITNISRQKDIERIRIYNKRGEIQYSDNQEELARTTNIKAEACFICHKQEPPLESAGLSERTRIFQLNGGQRVLGIISPIYNEPGCAADPCHVHPADKKVLGLLDVVISLTDTDRTISGYKKGIIGLAIFVFFGTSVMIGIFLMRFVNRPIKRLIRETRQIGNGDYKTEVGTGREDEIGELAQAIEKMGEEIAEKQEELHKQKEEYQTLFEQAPCFITVQDRDFRLIKYNRDFEERFDPRPGDFCYQAYKGRSERCEICPVIRTFEDGKPHFSEETGVGKDGLESHWVVRTSPIKNAAGEVVAAMEISLDVTRTRALEREVQKSEEKYRTIFNTIPNPVFMLDYETLHVLDCNDSVTAVYGFSKEEMVKGSFLDLFETDEREEARISVQADNILNQVKQIRKDGETIFVNIRTSRSEYMGREVLLVTTSDITKRLMAEQQLIQASKMATLGEMSTGVAHELNQPLSVIKTAGSFLSRKIKRGEEIPEDTLRTMAEEIDSQVDRASRIINHMREFGRKSEVKTQKVQLNDALRRSLEIFIQQLKLREIQVIQELDEGLPPIMANANRLEQVFINLLINARDAIEEKWEQGGQEGESKRITLRTGKERGYAFVEVEDTGQGIPAAKLDRIFEPFFTTKKVGKGTGLGLSISYGIVQDYDGTINVETEEGKGARFTIRFPLSEEIDDTADPAG
jgi:histidine kinase